MPLFYRYCSTRRYLYSKYTNNVWAKIAYSHTTGIRWVIIIVEIVIMISSLAFFLLLILRCAGPKYASPLYRRSRVVGRQFASAEDKRTLCGHLAPVANLEVAIIVEHD